VRLIFGGRQYILGIETTLRRSIFEYKMRSTITIKQQLISKKIFTFLLLKISALNIVFLINGVLLAGGIKQVNYRTKAFYKSSRCGSNY